MQSLDEPDKEIEKIWIEESEKRLKLFRTGKLKGIPFEKINPHRKAARTQRIINK